MTIQTGEEISRSMCHRAEEGEDGTMRFVASTDSVDRYDSRVMQHWRLESFNRNPMFLWMHDRRSKPLGRVEAFDVEENRSLATVQFAPTDAGEELRVLYAKGFLNAVSVGFRAGSVTYIEDDDIVELGSAEHPNELFELSGVTLPGNAEALAEGRAKGLTDNIDRQLRALFEPMMDRKLEAQDLDLLRIGAAPAQLDVLRSIHDRLDRMTVATSSLPGPTEDDLRDLKETLNQSPASEPAEGKEEAAETQEVWRISF